ncbi:hypothetical protein Tco_1062199 [Tanacetum coccineum]
MSSRHYPPTRPQQPSPIQIILSIKRTPMSATNQLLCEKSLGMCVHGAQSRTTQMILSTNHLPPFSHRDQILERNSGHFLDLMRILLKKISKIYTAVKYCAIAPIPETKVESILRITPNYEASRARGFVHRSLELHILSFIMGIEYPNLID